MAGELCATSTTELPIASTCGWCENARERTEALIAQGFQVSHGLCDLCRDRLDREMLEACG